MSQSTNRWLVVLLCVNAVLITAIIYHHVGLPRAEAQQTRSGNYVLLPVRHRNDEEQLCIIDFAGQRMITCRYNNSRKQIQFTTVLDIRLASEALQAGDRPR